MAKGQRRHRKPVDPDADLYQTDKEAAWARMQDLSSKLDAGVHPDSIRHSDLRGKAAPDSLRGSGASEKPMSRYEMLDAGINPVMTSGGGGSGGFTARQREQLNSEGFAWVGDKLYERDPRTGSVRLAPQGN